FGFRSRSEAAVSIMPGVQKPHCRPWCSLKASWIGSSPPAPSPSTVVTSRPSVCTANIVQDLIGTPSSKTVHAPQLGGSHPTWGPVSPKFSRTRWTSRVLGSTSAPRTEPLTVTLISIVSSRSGRAGHVGGSPQAALHEDIHDVALVVLGAANV